MLCYIASMSKIVLPPDLEAKAEARTASGAASSAMDVIRAGLEAHGAADAAKLDAIRAKVARSIADPRPSKTDAEVFDRVEAAISAIAKK